MTQASETTSTGQPAPVRVSRTFPVPRETVFKAWSSAGHVKRCSRERGTGMLLDRLGASLRS